MADRQHKAVEYRRQAEFCLEAAKRMSLRDDRDSLMEMAKRWLALAEEKEAADD